MKILHVLNSDKFSGAENVVCQIIEMFRGSNIEMAYCSPNGAIRETLNEKHIDFLPISKLCKSELKRVMEAYNPDIIHAHDFRASVMCSRFSKKTVVISHLHNNSPWLKKICPKTVLYGISCKKYKKILTVSGSVFDEFVFGKKYGDKCVCVGNPVSANAVRLMAETEKCGEHYDLCFCGRLTEAKNPIRFLEIVKLSGVKSAVMIGDGELRTNVEQRIKELDLSDVVTLKGFLKNPYPIIKGCKVFCLPSLWEGFGLVVVEALSLGVPVVCTSVGGLKGLVTEKCGKICDADDEFVNEIKRLLSDGNYLHEKQIGARNRADELDNIEQYKKALENVYFGVEKC